MKPICNNWRMSIAFLLMALNGLAQPVVTYPNGGEILSAGSSINITWSGTALNTTVGIDYTIDNWTNTIWLNTAYKNPAANSYTWLVPNTPSTQCKVGVFNTSFDGDISNNTFSIVPASSGIDEENAFKVMSIFPNPSNGVIYISNPIKTRLNFVIYDIMGKVQKTTFQSDGAGNYTLDKGMLQPGTYLLMIQDESNGAFMRKKIQVE